MFDVSKQAEQRDHSLGLKIMSAIETDPFLGHDETDLTSDQCIDGSDDLAYRTSDSAQLTHDQPVS